MQSSFSLKEILSHPLGCYLLCLNMKVEKMLQKKKYVPPCQYFGKMIIGIYV